MAFTSNDIASYYDQTLDHYNIWWNLKKSLSVHYGYWEPNTQSFGEALQNTNRKMALLAKIKPTDKVLDAGCGVGGAGFYLVNEIGCNVHGITLSEKQIGIALAHRTNFQKKHLIDFSLQDFTKTNFEENSFDVVWGCESTCYAYPKIAFIKEAKRLLKPEGKIIIADYFQTKIGKIDAKNHMKNWGYLWAIEEFHSHENFVKVLEQNGFEIEKNINVSENIFKSAKRMYRSYLIGMLPSKIYNLFHKTSHFGKKHYQSGYFQYKALKQNLWEYRMIVAKLNKL